jgi:hypothetical protein
MKKIASIIGSCIDCPHIVKAQTKASSNTVNVAICGFELEDTDTEPFLLLYTKHDNIRNFSIDIPDNCPLEDYIGTQTIEP